MNFSDFGCTRDKKQRPVAKGSKVSGLYRIEVVNLAVNVELRDRQLAKKDCGIIVLVT